MSVGGLLRTMIPAKLQNFSGLRNSAIDDSDKITIKVLGNELLKQGAACRSGLGGLEHDRAACRNGGGLYSSMSRGLDVTGAVRTIGPMER